MRLRGLAVVLLQESTLPLSTHDRADNGVGNGGNYQFVAQSLVRSLAVIKFREITSRRTQVLFSEDDQPAQALLLY